MFLVPTVTKIASNVRGLTCRLSQSFSWCFFNFEFLLTDFSFQLVKHPTRQLRPFRMYIALIIMSMITFISADHSKHYEKQDNERELTMDTFRHFNHHDVHVQRFVKTTIAILAEKPVISVLFLIFDGLTSCMMSQITSIMPLLHVVFK